MFRANIKISAWEHTHCVTRRVNRWEGKRVRGTANLKWILLSKWICCPMQSMCKRNFFVGCHSVFAVFQYDTKQIPYVDSILRLHIGLFTHFSLVLSFDRSYRIFVRGTMCSFSVSQCTYFATIFLCVILSYDLLVLFSFCFVRSFVRSFIRCFL